MDVLLLSIKPSSTSSLQLDFLGFDRLLSSLAIRLVFLWATMDHTTKAGFLSNGRQVLLLNRGPQDFRQWNSTPNLLWQSALKFCWLCDVRTVYILPCFVFSWELSCCLTRTSRHLFSASILAEINSRRGIDNSFKGATLVLLATSLTWVFHTQVNKKNCGTVGFLTCVPEPV